MDQDGGTKTPLRVLLVDDSATVRRLARSLLEQHGHQVTAASSGEEAFELCLRERFDLVVSDMTMGALGGVQLCRLLRSSPATASMPFLMLTAAHDRRSRFWARNAGADAYLAKEQMQAVLPPAVARFGKPRGTEETATRAHDPQPLQRLSALLDELLFSAVLTSETHRLIRHVEDRRALGKALVMLTGEVVDASYLVVQTQGVEGRASAVLARHRWPSASVARALAALDVEDPHSVETELEQITSEGEIETGEKLVIPIRVGDAEPIGELRAYSMAGTRLGSRDHEMLAHLGRESAIVIQSAVLAEQARALARTDTLTGLANRRATVERLTHEIERAQRYGQPFAIALCDIDKFKSINDSFGHASGDEVLRATATALKKSVRTVDLIGRWGGEEIMCVLPGASDAGVRVAAERLRTAIEQMPPFVNGPPKVTTSVGVACWAGEYNVDALVDRADRALYRAKGRGRNRVEIEPAMANAAAGAPAGAAGRERGPSGGT